MTSNSYHIIHVDFILFRFHIIILFVLLPCVMSFTSFNSYLLHVWHAISYSNKLIHIQWQIETYQSHTKYIQGQIRLIHRLFHLVIVLLNFCFQKCRDPNPRLDPIDGSKPEPGLLRRFQLSSQNILFGFIKFSFSKVSIPESPTQLDWRIQAGARFTPTFSIIISKHFVWFN